LHARLASLTLRQARQDGHTLDVDSQYVKFISSIAAHMHDCAGACLSPTRQD